MSNYKKPIKCAAGVLMLTLTLGLTACGNSSTATTTESNTSTSAEAVVATVSANANGILDTSDFFTERDLTQTADLSDATTYTLSDNEDITITEEGVYVISGSASNATIYVNADGQAKVQIVLDGASITNTDTPCIYILSADKVFVTTSGDSTLTVSDTFVTDEENARAVIYSKDDLVLNGTATLTINSSDEGVNSKDDLKITGGTYIVTAGSTAFEANDSIRIADGSFTINAGTDGLHAENNDNDSLGYLYIANGSFDIQSGDDAIHANAAIQIDDGSFTISAAEAIEGTYVQINGGTFDITASDDGINAARKSSAYDTIIDITGGDITISMGAGDTDALDANGDIVISGGSLNITATSAFDYDGTGTLTGGTVVVNGEEVTELTQSGPGGGGMMGGGRMGGGRMDANGPANEGQTAPADEGQTPPENEGQTPPQ